MNDRIFQKVDSVPPLLLWGIYFLIGSSWPIFFSWSTLIPLGVLLYFFPKKKTGVATLLIGCFFAFLRVDTPVLPEEGLEGEPLFSLQSIETAQTPFHTSYAMRGVCRGFEGYPPLPCILFVDRVPDAGSRWYIEGKLSQEGVLKPKSKTPWKKVDAPFSAARFRYEQKKKVAHFLEKRIGDKKVAQFFTAMTTGEKPSWLMRMEFRKVGLSHILAISGFHFGLIALLTSTFLRLFLPLKWRIFTLLALLTFYLFFLGASPSILRAYTMIALYLVGKLLRRKSDPLNLLGAALLLELLLDPTSLTTLSFQLSFLATFGILAFYPPLERAFRKILPKRRFKDVKQMPLLDQHGYLWGSGIRTALALNFAVQLSTLPLVLTHFGNIPLLSLPYNLLIPPLLALSLLTLPFAILLPPLRLLLVPFTSWILTIVGNPPEPLHFKFFFPIDSPFLLLTLLTLLLFFGLKKREASSENRLFVHGDRSSVG